MKNLSTHALRCVWCWNKFKFITSENPFFALELKSIFCIFCRLQKNLIQIHWNMTWNLTWTSWKVHFMHAEVTIFYKRKKYQIKNFAQLTKWIAQFCPSVFKETLNYSVMEVTRVFCNSSYCYVIGNILKFRWFCHQKYDQMQLMVLVEIWWSEVMMVMIITMMKILT